ncbi:MAG: ABC transporter permease [Chloroflexota bacterium]
MTASRTLQQQRPRPVDPTQRQPRSSRLHPSDVIGLGAVGLKTRRIRAALTMAGIAIGIAAMVGVLVISESSRSDLLAQLDRLGTNMLRVTAGQTLFGGSAELSPDARAMIVRIGPVEAASSAATIDATVRRTDFIDESRTGGISVTAVDLDLLDTLRAKVAAGSFLDEASQTLPTVMLGNTAARRLGIREPGVRVWLGGRWFSVIGILEPVTLASELDSAAFIGIPIAAQLFEYDGSPSTIYVRSETEFVEDVRAVLGRTSSPEDPSEVEVTRPSDVLEARAAAATAFTELFLGLGAVALIVGGVGIANVMLMSVLERRSEIGLRRALGATKRHIAMQFVSEALALAFMGGILGVTSGAGIAVAYALSQGWEPIVPAVAVGGGILAAVAIGALAGFYPAMRAARLSPTDALRGSE